MDENEGQLLANQSSGHLVNKPVCDGPEVDCYNVYYCTPTSQESRLPANPPAGVLRIDCLPDRLTPRSGGQCTCLNVEQYISPDATQTDHRLFSPMVFADGQMQVTRHEERCTPSSCRALIHSLHHLDHLSDHRHSSSAAERSLLQQPRAPHSCHDSTDGRTTHGEQWVCTHLPHLRPGLSFASFTFSTHSFVAVDAITHPLDA
ncbi:hypothetical protein EmuJ_000724300 [Echinococcus multilocularis]|uniref:Uncharacterized protein n=1 Tax=Echinococcus multilocularis TaxID=6211 RepID=A0A068YBV5_ECHMU|nr:hypothetical protein EmuJ_000724300 [Echinococcus multilocularis]